MHPSFRSFRRANHPGVSVGRGIHAKDAIEATGDRRKGTAISAANAAGTDGYANELREPASGGGCFPTTSV